MRSQTFKITLTASNPAGPYSKSIDETVTDQPPTVTIATVSPTTTDTSQTVTVHFTASDHDGTIQSLKVDWGDGTSDTLQTTATSVSHRYNSAKAYTITITATDDAGNTGTTTQTQTVIAPPAPVAILGLPPTTFYASLGGIIAIVIIAGAVLALRRKPKSSK